MSYKDQPAENGVDAIVAAARGALEVVTLKDGSEIAISPDNFNVQKLTKHEPTPPRIIETKRFSDGDSLSRYVERYKTADSLLLGDLERRTVRVLLDYHQQDGTPASVDHAAYWDVQYSQEFDAWFDMEGKLHPQADFLRFLEENVADIVSPDPAAMLELARDFSAIKQVNFKSSQRLDNGDRQLTYTEETGTHGKIEIPKKITFKVPIFYGEQAVNFEAFFRYRIKDGALFLGIDFYRIKPVIDAAFKQAVTAVSEATGLDAFYGA